MKKYSVLTKHINLLENDNAGEWSCDKENDGSQERPMHLPFVIYSITVKKLADDIYKFAKESDNKSFIIATEQGVVDRLKRDLSDKEIIPVKDNVVCPNMKMTSLEDILEVLETARYCTICRTF